MTLVSTGLHRYLRYSSGGRKLARYVVNPDKEKGSSRIQAQEAIQRFKSRVYRSWFWACNFLQNRHET